METRTMGMNRRNFLFAMLGAAGAMAGAGAWFLHTPKFGRLPSGARLERIKASPHYVNGRFQCLEPVENIMEGDENRWVATWKFVFGDKTGLVPPAPIPTRKTDWNALPRNEDIVIWLGHSSVYMQLGGQRILIDPVFSSYASPVCFINKAFPGTNIFTAADMPELDVLAISHDHWDHLDYETVAGLKPKVKQVVCPLGVGEYFEQWGFAANQLCEEDWDTEIRLADDLQVHILPSQHFSGRFLTPNPTEWCGFAFITSKRRVYYSGDGGYGSHFKAIGKRFNGFDLAIMENGQYNKAWHRIHLLPEETAQAATDVGAKALLPMHNGKFALARHPWDEPYRALTDASKGQAYQLITPLIGEPVHLGDVHPFDRWWES